MHGAVLLMFKNVNPILSHEKVLTRIIVHYNGHVFLEECNVLFFFKKNL